MDATKDEVTSFKCRKCRQVVFGATHLSATRCPATSTSEVGDDAAVLRLETAFKDIGHCQNTLWYIEEESAPSWVNYTIEKALFTKGKLNCPKCNGRLGAFDFIARRRCLCGRHMMPAIHITRNRVDPVCTKKNLTEMRPKLTARCNCNQSTQNTRPWLRGDLAQSEHSDLTSDAFNEESGSLGRVLPACWSTCPESIGPVRYGGIRLMHRDAAVDLLSQHPSNTTSFVTYRCNLSCSASAVRGHSSRSLPSSMAEDHNSQSLVEPSEQATTSMTKTEESGSVACLLGDDNRFSVLFSHEADYETSSQADVTGPVQEVVDQLTCAVCLCIFHEPHSCEPCGHVFCSSCLRRLCAASVTNTRCPLCRCNIQRCFPHLDFDEDIKRLFPDEVYSRKKLERKNRTGHLPLPGGQVGMFQLFRRRQYAPDQRSDHYFVTSVVLVLLLTMIAFTILATTVGVVVTYLVELFVDVGAELLDDVNSFFNYATQMLIVFCVEGNIPQDLSKQWLVCVHRIINDIARIANRTFLMGDSNESDEEQNLNYQRGIHTSYYTQYMLSKMAQANVANVILLSCLGIFVVYKLLQHCRLIR